MEKSIRFIDSTHPYTNTAIFARGIYSGPGEELRGRMIHGLPVKNTYSDQIYLCLFLKDGTLRSLPIERNTLSYDTGYRDRHNHRVYQGDIVDAEGPNGEIRRFVAVLGSLNRTSGGSIFNIHCAGFAWSDDVRFPAVTEDGMSCDTDKMEVIGNVFQNAELLGDDGFDLPF